MSRAVRRGVACTSMSDTPTPMRDTSLMGSETRVAALCNGGEYQFDIPCARADIGSLPDIPGHRIAGRAGALRPRTHTLSVGVDNPAA
ncbi:hypothetical protein ABIA39_002586 [Nocardia sp. GAS34]